MINNIIRGKSGEVLAKEYLLSIGYIILEKNYKNKIGEIDIIAKDGDIVVFVEVKTRTNYNYGYAFEAVDFRKQKKIVNTSLVYVKYRNLINTQLRYDIIEIYMTKNFKINHLKDAFCL